MDLLTVYESIIYISFWSSYGTRHGSRRVQGQRPSGGPGGKVPRIFLYLLPIVEHGLQFRFNEITYFSSINL